MCEVAHGAHAVINALLQRGEDMTWHAFSPTEELTVHLLFLVHIRIHTVNVALAKLPADPQDL